MLKFLFFFLLGANGLLFALGQGYLGNFHADQREPERLQNQFNADKIRLLSAASATAAVAAAKPPKAPERFACTEIGDFVLSEARQFEARVAELELGDRQSRHNVAGQDVSSYIVFIPPQGSKEGADKKAGELRQLGVKNYFIMSDSATMRWAISLGVFKSEAGAQGLLASLLKQGVHSARIAPRYASSKQVAFQFRDLDGAAKAQLDQIKADFPDQQMRSCK